MNPVSVVQPVPGYLERLAVVVACPAERQANVSVEPRRCREVGAVEPDMIQSDSALWRSSCGGGGNRDAVWISRSPDTADRVPPDRHRRLIRGVDKLPVCASKPTGPILQGPLDAEQPCHERRCVGGSFHTPPDLGQSLQDDTARRIRGRRARSIALWP